MDTDSQNSDGDMQVEEGGDEEAYDGDEEGEQDDLTEAEDEGEETQPEREQPYREAKALGNIHRLVAQLCEEREELDDPYVVQNFRNLPFLSGTGYYAANFSAFSP